MYAKFNGDKGVVMWLHMDDMLIFGTDFEQVESTKRFLSQKFDMKDLGKVDVILGIKITKHNDSILLSQSHYIEKVLRKFRNYDSILYTQLLI